MERTQLFGGGSGQGQDLTGRAARSCEYHWLRLLHRPTLRQAAILLVDLAVLLQMI